MMLSPAAFIGRSSGHGRPLLLAFIPLLALSTIQAEEAEPRSNEEDEAWSVRQGIDDVTQEYLSDRRRAGSLAGGLLGGALMAHPAGTLVGSIAGFFLGKATHHDNPTASNASQLQASRRFAPTEPDAEAPVLSLSDPDTGTLAWDRPTPTPAEPRQGLAGQALSPAQSEPSRSPYGIDFTIGDHGESSGTPVVKLGLPPARPTMGNQKATQEPPQQLANSSTAPDRTTCSGGFSLAYPSRQTDCDASSKQGKHPQSGQMAPIHWVHPDYR